MVPLPTASLQINSVRSFVRSEWFFRKACLLLVGSVHAPPSLSLCPELQRHKSAQAVDSRSVGAAKEAHLEKEGKNAAGVDRYRSSLPLSI